MFTLFAGLALVSATLCRGENATFPQTIEVDLVFPRNNTTYKPTNYFPVVFAVQNARTAWPLGLQLSVEVRPLGNFGENDESDVFVIGDVGGGPGPTSGNASADPSLLIHTTNIITNNTENQFAIIWNYILEDTCTDTGYTYTSEVLHISFNTSVSAATPDISAAVDSCPSQFSLLDLDQQSETTIGPDGKKCPFDIFGKHGAGRGDPCKLKPLAQAIAANVSAAMCAAENGTLACKSTAGLHLIHHGLGTSSILVLVMIISALSLCV